MRTRHHALHDLLRTLVDDVRDGRIKLVDERGTRHDFGPWRGLAEVSICFDHVFFRLDDERSVLASVEHLPSDLADLVKEAWCLLDPGTRHAEAAWLRVSDSVRAEASSP